MLEIFNSRNSKGEVQKKLTNSSLSLHWDYWLNEIQSLSSEAIEWDYTADFLEHLMKIAQAKLKERQESRSILNAQIKTLNEEHKELLNYFGFTDCYSWVADGCPGNQIRRQLQILEDFSLILKHYENLLLPSSSLTAAKTARLTMEAIEPEINRLHSDLAKVLAPHNSGPLSYKTSTTPELFTRKTEKSNEPVLLQPFISSSLETGSVLRTEQFLESNTSKNLPKFVLTPKFIKLKTPNLGANWSRTKLNYRFLKIAIRQIKNFRLATKSTVKTTSKSTVKTTSSNQTSTFRVEGVTNSTVKTATLNIISTTQQFILSTISPSNTLSISNKPLEKQKVVESKPQIKAKPHYRLLKASVATAQLNSIEILESLEETEPLEIEPLEEIELFEAIEEIEIEEILAVIPTYHALNIDIRSITRISEKLSPWAVKEAKTLPPIQPLPLAAHYLPKRNLFTTQPSSIEQPLPTPVDLVAPKMLTTQEPASQSQSFIPQQTPQVRAVVGHKIPTLPVVPVVRQVVQPQVIQPQTPTLQPQIDIAPQITQQLLPHHPQLEALFPVAKQANQPIDLEVELQSELNIVSQINQSPKLKELPAIKMPQPKEAALALQDNDSSNGWREFIWSLITFDDIPGAFWVTKSLELAEANQPIPLWLLKALEGGRLISSATDILVNELKEVSNNTLNTSLDQLFFGLAAAIRPALIAPSSQMSKWIKAIPNFPQLNQLISSIDRFLRVGIPLQRKVLLDIVEINQCENNILSFNQEFAAWLDKSPNGIKQEFTFLLSVNPSDRYKVAIKTKSSLTQWQVVLKRIETSSPTNNSNKADREKAAKDLQEICKLALRWCDLVERQHELQSRSNEITVAVEKLQSEVASLLPRVESELNDLKETSQDLSVIAATTTLLRTLIQLKETLNPLLLSKDRRKDEKEKKSEEILNPDAINDALARRLAWLREIKLDDKGQPKAESSSLIAEAIRDFCVRNRRPRW